MMTNMLCVYTIGWTISQTLLLRHLDHYVHLDLLYHFHPPEDHVKTNLQSDSNNTVNYHISRPDYLCKSFDVKRIVSSETVNVYLHYLLFTSTTTPDIHFISFILSTFFVQSVLCPAYRVLLSLAMCHQIFCC